MQVQTSVTCVVLLGKRSFATLQSSLKNEIQREHWCYLKYLKTIYSI